MGSYIKENRLCRLETKGNFDINPSTTSGLRNYTILNSSLKRRKHELERDLTPEEEQEEREETERREREESRIVAETLSKPGEELINGNLSDKEKKAVESHVTWSLVEKFKQENYDFNGTLSGESESKKKFAEEVIWICKKLKKNPLKIIWTEIFPRGSNINFTGGKLAAEEQSKNIEELNKVEAWIRANL